MYAFEAMALVIEWPKPQWVTVLGPYLTGLAQVILKTLSPAELGNYDRVKAAILERYEVIPETQHQCFRALCFKIGEHCALR